MFTKLELRELLRCVSGSDIDDDLLAKLQGYIGGALSKPATANVTQEIDKPMLALHRERLIEKDQPPAYVPLTYTDAQLAKIKIPEGEGFREATQDDVAMINAQKKAAQDNEWRAAQAYVPNINPLDAVNAAFAPPDIPAGYGVIEKVAVGRENSAGDICIALNESGTSVYRCKAGGHGYVQGPSLRGCPVCFSSGGGVTVSREDRGTIRGEDSDW